MKMGLYRAREFLGLSDFARFSGTFDAGWPATEAYFGFVIDNT